MEIGNTSESSTSILIWNIVGKRVISFMQALNLIVLNVCLQVVGAVRLWSLSHGAKAVRLPLLHIDLQSLFLKMLLKRLSAHCVRILSLVHYPLATVIKRQMRKFELNWTSNIRSLLPYVLNRQTQQREERSMLSTCYRELGNKRLLKLQELRETGSRVLCFNNGANDISTRTRFQKVTGTLWGVQLFIYSTSPTRITAWLQHICRMYLFVTRSLLVLSRDVQELERRFMHH